MRRHWLPLKDASSVGRALTQSYLKRCMDLPARDDDIFILSKSCSR